MFAPSLPQDTLVNYRVVVVFACARYTQDDATGVSSSLSSAQSPTSGPIIAPSTSTSSSSNSAIAVSTATATATTTATATVAISHSKLLAIIFGSLFGVLGLLFAIFALWYFSRRKRPAAIQPFAPSTNPSAMSAIQPNMMNDYGQSNYGQWPQNQLDDNATQLSRTLPSDSDTQPSVVGQMWYNPGYSRVGTSPSPPTTISNPYSDGGYRDNMGSPIVMHQPPMKGRNPDSDEPPGYSLVVNRDRIIAQMGDGMNPLSTCSR